MSNYTDITQNTYIQSSMVTYIYIHTHTSSIRNNAVHDLTLIKLTVARFVGTGLF